MITVHSQPLVSCIMPTANRRQFVPQAIQYFQRQDYANKELVILDDGSDSAADLVPDDPQIRYLRLSGKRTLGVKRNECVEASRGDLIMHWDDDDWMATNRISYQVEELLKVNAEVCGLREMIYYEPATDKTWLYRYPADQRPWLAGNSLLYTRDFWRRSPFPNIQVGSDTRFIFSQQLDRSVSLQDYQFYVGTIHAGNTSPKVCRGSYWSHWSGDLKTIVGNDWETFQLTHGQNQGASFTPHLPMSCDKGATKMSNIAVIITCHEPCLKYLPEALESVNNQLLLPAERWVVFDRCEPLSGLDRSWNVLKGDWGHPSCGRNAGIAASSAPWLIFWDADNVMPKGYIEAIQKIIETTGHDVAILYPDIHYCDENLRPQRLWITPEWDYWNMRAENCIDTASAWRREALDLVGGWSTRSGRSPEDYVLAMDVTAAGWKAAKSKAPPILKRIVPDSRSQNGTTNDIWNARSLAIVTLLAGRDSLFQKWSYFLQNAELPSKASLYVVDNSGRAEFTRRAYETCQQITNVRNLTHLYFSSIGQPYPIVYSNNDQIEMRHRHVARLYTSIFPRIQEELILTLEDDVEPPLNAIRMLGIEFGWYSPKKIGAIAAAYPMAYNHSCVCAGAGKDVWGAAIRFQQLTNDTIEVGCVGGGCTMWANWAIKGHPINFWWDRKLGWDASLSIQIKRRGYRVLLHGGVRCQHHAHGQLDSKIKPEISKSLNEPKPKHISKPIHKNSDSWIPIAKLGTCIPPYKPTFEITNFINERHKSFSKCALRRGDCIDVGISGWLRREDALKLYELAYFAQDDILELGCNEGLSTSILAQAIEDSDNKKLLHSIDIEITRVNKTLKNLKSRRLDQYVQMICGDAAQICRKLIQEKRNFGFIFIDHSHSYQDVADICRLLPQLLLDDGFCLFHDFNDGRNIDPTNFEYKVSQAVHDSIYLDEFEFYGIFGCTALYRKQRRV